MTALLEHLDLLCDPWEAKLLDAKQIGNIPKVSVVASFSKNINKQLARTNWLCSQVSVAKLRLD